MEGLRMSSCIIGSSAGTLSRVLRDDAEGKWKHGGNASVMSDFRNNLVASCDRWRRRSRPSAADACRAMERCRTAFAYPLRSGHSFRQLSRATWAARIGIAIVGSAPSISHTCGFPPNARHDHSHLTVVRTEDAIGVASSSKHAS